MRTPSIRLRSFPSASILLALSLAACSAGTSTGPTGTPTAAATTGAAPSASTASTTPGSAARVSANSASQAEISTALAAAGVPNADRWAREVVEYRPYAADDPTLQKLQDNLAKYNPDAATLAGILSALVP